MMELKITKEWLERKIPAYVRGLIRERDKYAAELDRIRVVGDDLSSRIARDARERGDNSIGDRR